MDATRRENSDRMPIVNRLLDAFFRTLDAVDMARERIDRALGRAPRPEPWTTEWSPTPEPHAGSGSAAPSFSTGSSPAPSPVPSTSKPATIGTKKAAPTTVKKQAPAKKQAARTTTRKPGTNRKGSVDKKGTDIDSARAKAIFAK